MPNRPIDALCNSVDNLHVGWGLLKPIEIFEFQQALNRSEESSCQRCWAIVAMKRVLSLDLKEEKSTGP